MEDDFGKYLAVVQERDIDLLLMEEFHVSESFVQWFASQVGLASVQFAGAWHSVADQDGETDLLLRVSSEGVRTGILIENKVAANEQFEQDLRYHLRGARSLEAGRFEKYVTCMCAPQSYLDGMNADSRYDFRVSYEAVREWFSQFSNARSIWRARIITEAIEQGRRGYVMLVDQAKTQFHRSYWEYVCRRHPRLKMNDPKNKGPNSVWIILKTHDMPSKITLDHKIDRHIMDLTFQATSVDDLLRIKSDWPKGITPHQVGKSTALRKTVPKLDMAMPLEEQLEAFEEILSAAYELSAYSKIFQRPG